MSLGLTKITPSTNITPGTPIFYTITLSIPNNGNEYRLVNVRDPLPNLNSGSLWSILSQSPPNLFIIENSGANQLLIYNGGLAVIAPGQYTVTVVANTNILDAGSNITNTATSVLFNNGQQINLSSSVTLSVLLCIHGSSMIKLDKDQEMEISKIKDGQMIIGADGNTTELIELVECWAGLYNKEFGTCVIFEKDSIGPGIPSSRFAVDAGHPISTPDDYKKNGNISLKPAKLYLNVNQGIYSVTWDQVESLLPGENKRYDLIMKEDSCNAYIANGLVVQARKDKIIPGYNYE